jgi:hypothetical protein
MAENDFANPVIDGGGYGDDWQAAAAEQERRRRDEEMTARMNENRADLAQYDEMLGAQRAQAAQRRANGLRQTAIAMRYAMQNGGKVPEQLIPAFNQKMGYDGKTRRFLGGMYGKDGSITFFMQNGDGQGNFQDAPVTLDRRGQFDLMRESPGIFSDEDVNAMAQSLMTKDGLTRDQIWGAGATPGSKTATGGTVVNPSWLFGPRRRSSISAFGADGRGGFTNYESNEQTGYQLQQRDSGTRAPQPELSERERIALTREQGQMERSRMNNESREKLQRQKNEAAIQVAETSAGATKSKADAMRYVADVRAKIKEAQSGKGGWTPTAGDLAKLGKLMEHESGLSDDQRNEVASLMSGMAEVMAKGLKKEDNAPPPSGKTGVKQGNNDRREIRKDRNGVEWEIVRDENGKPIGKKRVTR